MTQKIASNERVFICGKTGSGKTFLAHYLTKPIRRLVVFDGKGTLWKWGLLEWGDQAAKLLKEGEPVRVRASTPRHEDAAEYWNRIFDLCLDAGDLTIYVDEIYRIVDPGTKPPAQMVYAWTSGRELGVGCWAATQRPASVPLFTRSEAEHYFMFRLTLEDDRKRMAEFMTPAVLDPIKDKHGFYYMAAENDSPVYFPELQTGIKAPKEPKEIETTSAGAKVPA